MGNACRVSAIDHSSDIEHDSGRWITILQANGEAIQIGDKIKAGEVMLRFPHHFLCHASSILLRRKSKMIPAKTRLQPGKIYLLLPLPEQQQQHQEDELNLHNPDEPLLAASKNTQGTTKFVISKYYLDRILSEKQSCRKSSVRRSAPIPRQKKSSGCKRRESLESSRTIAPKRSSALWCPELDSIPEK